LELTIIVSVGVSGDHLRAQLLGPYLKGIQIGLPTLSLHSFEGKTYQHFVSVLRVNKLCAKGYSENGGQNRQPASGLRQGIFLPIYADQIRAC
jgi:hypothetical protein